MLIFLVILVHQVFRANVRFVDQDITRGAGEDLGGRCSKGRGTIQRINRVLKLTSLRKMEPPLEHANKASKSAGSNSTEEAAVMAAKSANGAQGWLYYAANRSDNYIYICVCVCVIATPACDNTRFNEYWKALEQLAVNSNQ